MKFFFLMILFAFGAQAGDGKLCDHLRENTFKTHAASFGVDSKSDAGKLVAKVNSELGKKVDEQCKIGILWAVKDYDTCSSACVVNGGNDLTKMKINDTTRECQRYCKSYQLSAFAFQDGERSNDEDTPKCGAQVNDDQFGTHKSDLTDKVKQQVKIQKDASNQ
jgi:hypothetical protein